MGILEIEYDDLPACAEQTCATCGEWCDDTEDVCESCADKACEANACTKCGRQREPGDDDDLCGACSAEWHECRGCDRLIPTGRSFCDRCERIDRADRVRDEGKDARAAAEYGALHKEDSR